jgi:hypothetical protein
VLATDIRRLTGFSAAYQELPLEVYDVFDLIETCEARLELPSLKKAGPDEQFDIWATRRVERIIETDKSNRRVAQLWKFIIVDEAQDLKDYAWELLDWLSGAGAALFVVDGKRQQLYRTDRAIFLDITLREAVQPQNKKVKRRVFRTSSETFLLGQLFVEAYPSVPKAEKLWQGKYLKQYLEAKNKNASQITFEFELAREGAAPVLHNLATLIPASRFDADMATEYTASLIRKALDRLEPLDITPSDILLLVPFAANKGSSIDWKNVAVSACTSLGLDYLDYTVNEFRRVAYSPNDIRIATYHSSRGIEASHSIVLGLECLSVAAKEMNDVAANLGYISLTQSLFETDLVYYRSPAMVNADIAFIEKVLRATGF